MKPTPFKWLRLGLTLVVALVALAPLGQAPQAAAQAPGPQVGLVCTSAGPNPTFTLVTQTGHILLPDGNTMFMWGYSLDGQPFQHPSPVLCVNQGDTVTIILKNSFDEPVSIMFPGQDDVLADGQPAQPQFDGDGNLVSLTNAAAPLTGSVTYSFVAGKPGSFIYESGTDPKKQVNMGLFGALIVRPSQGANYVYNRADSQFTPAEEFLTLLSEIDPYQHQAAEQGKAYYDAHYDIANYHTHYWLLNGRAFPDTIADNFAPWLPSQPYGALARIYPYDAAAHPYPGLERFINVGTEDIPFHPHGNNGLVIGRDGNPLETETGQDLAFEKFAINIGAGQTWDVIFKWYDAERYNGDEFLADGVTPNPDYNPVPVTIPDLANQAIGMFYSGSPYLGKMGPMPPGMSTLNQCGEYYIISHNHALFQLDAWGMTMAGQITYLRVDPPQPNNCP